MTPWQINQEKEKTRLDPLGLCVGVLTVVALLVVAMVVIEIVRSVSRRRATERATEKARSMLVSAKSSLQSVDSGLESGSPDHVIPRCDLARQRLTSAIAVEGADDAVRREAEELLRQVDLRLQWAIWERRLAALTVKKMTSPKLLLTGKVVIVRQDEKASPRRVRPTARVFAHCRSSLPADFCARVPTEVGTIVWLGYSSEIAGFYDSREIEPGEGGPLLDLLAQSRMQTRPGRFPTIKKTVPLPYRVARQRLVCLVKVIQVLSDGQGQVLFEEEVSAIDPEVKEVPIDGSGRPGVNWDARQRLYDEVEKGIATFLVRLAHEGLKRE